MGAPIPRRVLNADDLLDREFVAYEECTGLHPRWVKLTPDTGDWSGESLALTASVQYRALTPISTAARSSPA